MRNINEDDGDICFFEQQYHRITIVSCQKKIMGNLCARGQFMLPLTNSLMNLSSIVVRLLYLSMCGNRTK